MAEATATAWAIGKRLPERAIAELPGPPPWSDLQRLLDPDRPVPDRDLPLRCERRLEHLPDLHPIVFDLIEEVLDVAEADALHVGMDEILMMPGPGTPYYGSRGSPSSIPSWRRIVWASSERSSRR